MKRRRLILAILFAFPVICSAASKEIVELQRDVAQLQDQVRTLQSAFDIKIGALTVLVQQSVDAANKANTAVAGLQGGIQEQMRQQGKEVVGPVANVGTKIDEMANAFQQVQNSMADVTARLGNLEQQMKDLSNAVRTMQTPAAPPPTTSGVSAPGPTASAPPSGDMLYTNANRDRLGGKLDLALQVGPGVVEPQQPEPLGADRHHLEPAVVVPRDLPQRRGAADLVERRNPVHAGLAALTDRDHAELLRLRALQEVADELPVPLLEDVQRQHKPRVEHGAEREQRHRLAHIATLCRPPR